MESLELKTREPTKEEIDEMQFYLKTGCVHEDYLKRVLGDQSMGISVMPRQYSN